MKRILMVVMVYGLLILGIGSSALAIEGKMKIEDGIVHLVISDNGQEKSFDVWPVTKFFRCNRVSEYTFGVQLMPTSTPENGMALVEMGCSLQSFSGKADVSYFLVNYKFPKTKAGYRTLNSFVYRYAAPFGPGWEGEYEKEHPVTFTGSKGYITSDYVVILSRYINRDLYGQTIRERKIAWNAYVLTIESGLMVEFTRENITGDRYADLNVLFPVVEQEERSVVLRFGDQYKEYQWVIDASMDDKMYCKVTTIDRD